jgi:hypothetical protein
MGKPPFLDLKKQNYFPELLLRRIFDGKVWLNAYGVSRELLGSAQFRRFPQVEPASRGS